MIQKKFVFQLVLIVIVLLIPIFSSPDFDGSMRLFQTEPFQRDFFKHVLFLAFFFLNHYLLFPRLFRARRYWIYGLIVVLFFILISNLSYWVFQNHQPDFMNDAMNRMTKDDYLFKPYFSSLFPFLFVCVLTIALYAFQQKQEHEIDKVKAELLNLKYQLQPHFVLNILNNIYSLTLMKSDGAAESVMKLSHIMHYILSESSKESVSLEREFEHIKDYIALQLLKTDDSIDFSFQMEGETDGLEIAPILLINFIENAFKYGINSELKSVIRISIEVVDGILQMDVFNKKVSRPFHEDVSTKIGIENTIRRLKHVYPDNHSLTIEDENDVYHVHLMIRLR